jgi:hypothetical protein
MCFTTCLDYAGSDVSVELERIWKDSVEHQQTHNYNEQPLEHTKPNINIKNHQDNTSQNMTTTLQDLKSCTHIPYI